ncbi:MAG: hypothetical protein H0W89_06850 [Candidatus Levybacteria bacterium]|nr:hypothetical protein [Candidatus Levybacteria bacterium]
MAALDIKLDNDEKSLNGLYTQVENFRKTYVDYDPREGGKGSDIGQFIEDIANGCKRDNGAIDIAVLTKRLDAISPMLTVFGSENDVNLLVKDFAITHGVFTQTGETKNQLAEEATAQIAQPLQGTEQIRIKALRDKMQVIHGTKPPEAPIRTETPTNETLSPEQIADRLLDYETGKIKPGSEIDLRPSFEQLTQNVTARMKSHPEEFPADKPVIVLSDVARAMIDRIATQANKIDREFALTFIGVSFTRDSGNPVYVAAFATPASDYENPRSISVSIDPTIAGDSAIYMAHKTNLAAYFESKGNNQSGMFIATPHIHYASLGEIHEAAPSQGDYRQAEEWLGLVESGQRDRVPHMGVITKTQSGELKMNIVKTLRAPDGSVQYQENLPLKFESDFAEASVTEPTRTTEPEQREESLTPAQIADRLLNYRNGEVKADAGVDLKPSYTEFLGKATEYMNQHPEHFPEDRPIIVLSDVAVAMIDRIASEGNRRGVEFAFALQGVKKVRANGNDIQFVAYAVPASDFENPRVATVDSDPQLHGVRAQEMAQATNLNDVFPMFNMSTVGNPGSMLHIHHTGLGEYYYANPSGPDLAVSERGLIREEQGQAIASKIGVVTKKPNGELAINILKTYRAPDGTVQHVQHSPIISESTFPAQST